MTKKTCRYCNVEMLKAPGTWGLIGIDVVQMTCDGNSDDSLRGYKL